MKGISWQVIVVVAIFLIGFIMMPSLAGDLFGSCAAIVKDIGKSAETLREQPILPPIK